MSSVAPAGRCHGRSKQRSRDHGSYRKIRDPREQLSTAAELSAILLAGLQALADAGQGDEACRLAGRACAVLRHGESREWRRFNALLHRLAPRTGPVGAAVASDDKPLD